MKNQVLEIVGEVILYFIIVFVISFTFNKFGWLDEGVLKNAFFLTAGWCIWKGIYYFIKKKRKG